MSCTEHIATDPGNEHLCVAGNFEVGNGYWNQNIKELSSLFNSPHGNTQQELFELLNWENVAVSLDGSLE